MIENSDDLIQFSSPQPNNTGATTLPAHKTPKSLLDSSLTSHNNTLIDELNESKLDRVDFIEVAELDHDDMWLCEPHSPTHNKENVKSVAKKSKNAYRWMMDDFDQDKKLDKVKRTLLVTLDDISKGFNRRSRSVSTTRTNHLYCNNMAPPPTPSSRFLEPQTPQIAQSKSIESILNESTADLNRTYSKESGLDLINSFGRVDKPVSNRPSVKQLFDSAKDKESLSSLSDNEIEDLDENVFYEQAQRWCVLDTDEDKDEDELATHLAQIELYLDWTSAQHVCAGCRTNSSSSSIKKPSRQHSIRSLEWDAEEIVIDSNYYQNGIGANSKYATIVKAKKACVDQQTAPIDTLASSPSNLTYSNDSNDLTENKTDVYEDFTDLQVVAKMQEESLRQSVLNLTKISTQNLSRNGFSTATITKRVHPTRPSFALQLPSELPAEASLRRDSASSSDHSSISSTNIESPYNSQFNVNSSEFFWDDEALDLLDSTKLESLDTSSPEKSVPQLCSRCSRPLDQGTNGVQSPAKKSSQMAKSSTITHGISSVSSKPKSMVARSSTPSTRNISRESRLPTPRSSGALNTSLTVNVKSAQSKSPSNLVGRNLQLCKPPPAPLTNQTNQTNQTPSARRLIAYGSQRSATTSIVPSQSQIKAALFHNKNQVQKCAQKTKAMPRAATNQSINRASSPATHQIGSALSPRSHSPTQLIAHLSSKISPAGVGRERSSSPVNKLGSQGNVSHGSNSNLQTIAETRIPAHLNSPAMNRKMTSQVKARRSFLPQPAQSTVANRQSSISPSRTRNVSPADWKDGCY